MMDAARYRARRVRAQVETVKGLVRKAAKLVTVKVELGVDRAVSAGAARKHAVAVAAET